MGHKYPLWNRLKDDLSHLISGSLWHSEESISFCLSSHPSYNFLITSGWCPGQKMREWLNLNWRLCCSFQHYYVTREGEGTRGFFFYLLWYPYFSRQEGQLLHNFLLCCPLSRHSNPPGSIHSMPIWWALPWIPRSLEERGSLANIPTLHENGHCRLNSNSSLPSAAIKK